MRRLQTRFVFLFLIAIYSQVLLAADLEALPEFLRSDPFGAIVAPDRSGADLASSLYRAKHQVVLTGCRGGYVSFHLVVKLPSPSAYTLDTRTMNPPTWPRTRRASVPSQRCKPVRDLGRVPCSSRHASASESYCELVLGAVFITTQPSKLSNCDGLARNLE